MADDSDFASKPNAEEQGKLDRLYNRNAAEPLPPPKNKADFYSHSVGLALFDRREPELHQVAGLDAAQRQQKRAAYAEIERTTGLPDNVMAAVIDADVDATLAGARVMTDAEAEEAEIALQRQIQANNEQLREHFAKQYGRVDGEKLLERTNRWVKSHPKLAAILKENGIGSRIDIVEAIAAHVFSNGIR